MTLNPRDQLCPRDPSEFNKTLHQYNLSLAKGFIYAN